MKAIESRINKNIAGLKISDTLAINQKSKLLIKEGKRIFRFGLGQSPFPVPKVVVDALKLYAPQKDYLDVKGLLRLREAVSDFHRKKDLVSFSPENIMIGPGSKELLFLAQLAFDGDILIPSPSWVSYVPQAKILEKNIQIIHSNYTNNWLITSDLLEQVCKKSKRPKLLILNYPGNPDGMSYSEQELKAIAKVAKEEGLIILSDEIYGQIHHQGNHISIARFYPEGTIISSGLSKWCGAGGWRLGTFSFPSQLNWLMEAMLIVASETFTSVSAPIQYAAVSAFSGDETIEDYLWHVRRILEQLGNKCVEILRKSNIKVLDPIGGFYLFLDFENLKEKLAKHNILDSKILCDKLLSETGVALLPGTSFNREGDEISLRMAYVDFDGAKALSSSKRISLNQKLPDDFCDKWCANVLVGTSALTNWINNL